MRHKGRKLNIGARIPAVSPVGFESLESRRMLAATAPSFLAVIDGTQNFGDTRRAVAYYDVSQLESYGGSTFFNQTPTFVVWTGYEDTLGRNFEDPQALAINSANGDSYLLAFDSGSPGTVDSVGDTEGDYDLYRFNIASIYADFIANNRPKGTMYAPGVTSDGFDAIGTYGSTTPAVTDLDIGVPPLRSNTDGDTTNNIVFLNGIIEKIGEVRRYGASGDTPFFDQQDLQFVDSETLLLMESTLVDPPGGPGALNQDYSIRTLERVNLSPGSALPKTNDTGGYNQQTTESWESFVWTGDNFVDMDNHASTGDLSDVDGMRYVERDGVKGIWVTERDGGGDDFQFFSLDFGTRTATKRGGFALDENPVANDNQGDLDFFEVDENGTLFVSESGFFDGPQTEPNVQSLTISSYTGTVTFGTWTVEPNLAPTIDDDANVTDGRFGVLNRGQDFVYFFDIDTGGNVADIYVYDLNSNTLVYQELDAANHFFGDANSIRSFTLGDFAHQDGIVNQDDIDALYERIADPTDGGTFTAAVGQEMFDLSGDDLLTVGDPFGIGSVTGDMDYLIRRSLGTEYGDLDLNGVIDADDFFLADLGLLTSGSGYGNGDVDGNGVIDADDFAILDFVVLVNPSPTRV